MIRRPSTALCPTGPSCARSCGRGIVVALTAALALLPTATAQARVLMTVDEALQLAFPGCEIERRTVFLTGGQKAAASELAGAEIEQGLVYPYRARCGDSEADGTAYFDTHRVRTLEETVMIVVRDGRVARIDVLAFREPLDYLPGDRWYAQFVDAPLTDELELGRLIRPVAGATLTARATADASRRVLALHSVIEAVAEATP